MYLIAIRLLLSVCYAAIRLRSGLGECGIKHHKGQGLVARAPTMCTACQCSAAVKGTSRQEAR